MPLTAIARFASSLSAEKKLALAFALLVMTLMLVVLLLAPAKEEGPRFPSTYSAQPHGAKAAYLVLKESGYATERWTEPPQALPQRGAGGVLLIIAEPSETALPAEKQALIKFLSRGGRILAIGRGAAAVLPIDHSARIPAALPALSPIPPVLPSRITRGGLIHAHTYRQWTPETLSEVTHFASRQGAAVISYPYGEGEVIWWADSNPITNAGIKEAGNLELLLNCAGDRSTRILWDEYFHGSHSAWQQAAGTPLPWMLVQCGLLLAVVLFTHSRRSGPVHPPAQAPRLSPLEFVETLGGLYARAKGQALAVEVAHDALRRALAHRLGLRPDAAPEALARAASERLAWNGDELLNLLQQSDSATRDSQLLQAEALELVRRLNHFSQALQSRAWRT